MFGCGLPVLSAAYSCIDELIVEGRNGLLFDGARQLAGHLSRLLEGFPGPPDGPLSRLRAGVGAERGQTWDEAWQQHVLPLLG